jgi:catalase (peroxidase I)
MNRTATMALIAGVIALGATAAYAAAAPEAAAQGQQAEQTPKGWSYAIENGQRVPKGNRVTNPDGSWREELRQGNCVTIKEKSAAGEYKETRQCNAH